MASKITLPYTPRPWQLDVHNSLKRFNVLVIGRRSGKTVLAVNELIKRVVSTKKKNPQVAYIAPSYKQAKAVSWGIFKEYVLDIPGIKINESELRIDFENGGRILVLGAENPDSLRGLYLDFAVLDEVADMPRSLWTHIIRPALSDRSGGALFIGTPKGRNFFYDLYTRACRDDQTDWYAALYSTGQTQGVNTEELKRAKEELGDEVFAQEYECSFSANIRGAYYAKEMALAEKEKRICAVRYDPDYEVHTAWDIGLDGICVWFAQVVNSEIRIIDFEFAQDEDIPYMANIVKQKPYVYGRAYLPHDSKKRSIMGKGSTPRGQIEKLGLRTKVVDKIAISEGIHATRNFIRKAVFDSIKCEKTVKQGNTKLCVGLESLRQYRSEYDDRHGVLKDTPVHDVHSHPADAFRYLATGVKASGTTKDLSKPFDNFNPFGAAVSDVRPNEQWDPLDDYI